MNTQQLESFIQVAENLNFARAAEILNVTQSSISRQIHALEEELDTKLFQRSTRTVSLTPAGISFLNDAKEILGKLQLASQKLKSHSTSNVEILTIGCIYEAALPLLTSFLEQCHNKLPEIHPFLRIDPSRIILNSFIRGEIDVLFGFKDDITLRDGINYYELAQIPICCAMLSTHRLASKEEIEERDIFNENIVICNSYELPSQIAGIQNQLSRHSLPEATYFCETPHSTLALVNSGYGIAVLPKIPLDDVKIKYVPLANTDSISYGVFYKNAAKDPILKKFLSFMNVK